MAGEGGGRRRSAGIDVSRKARVAVVSIQPAVERTGVPCQSLCIASAAAAAVAASGVHEES